jgi:hypothetical protein
MLQHKFTVEGEFLFEMHTPVVLKIKYSKYAGELKK